ncbi:putative quinone-oxidoreductase homolog chloroplastic [Phtheirospermum japonicum]|uniref:Putative quinone-oxidoreductase homolog chloroplastic n=1 Tax=Phtheirospermum japonicum TaxID=374723 RepID=A0A830CCU9_9LAMI|nr:putative quinone-oxidoreductase homolog chloroplastic [Phtheirospermum japonicum]
MQQKPQPEASRKQMSFTSVKPPVGGGGGGFGYHHFPIDESKRRNLHREFEESIVVKTPPHVGVPVPIPSKGEVLLKLEATIINPIDWKTQKGMLRPLLPWKFPFIPATDIAER